MKDTLEPPEKIKTVSSIKAESKESIKKIRQFIKLNKELQPMIVEQDLLEAEWQEKYIRFSKYVDSILSKLAELIKAHTELEISLLEHSTRSSKQEDN